MHGTSPVQFRGCSTRGWDNFGRSCPWWLRHSGRPTLGVSRVCIMDEPISGAPVGSAPDSLDDRSPGSTLEGALILGDPACAALVAAELSAAADTGDPAT
jgi:hypothetical protein